MNRQSVGPAEPEKYGLGPFTMGNKPLSICGMGYYTACYPQRGLGIPPLRDLTEESGLFFA